LFPDKRKILSGLKGTSNVYHSVSLNPLSLLAASIAYRIAKLTATANVLGGSEQAVEAIKIEY